MSDLLGVIRAYALAHMASVVVVWVPNGIGVREWCLHVLLAGTPLGPVAGLAAMLMRLIVTGVELLYAAAGWWLYKFRAAEFIQERPAADTNGQASQHIPHPSGRGILVISYNGVLEPIVQSQVLPYLRALGRAGYRFVLVSFEKWTRPRAWMRQAIAEMRATLAQDGIRWHPLRYHKWPTLPATVWDLWCGSWVALWLAWRHRIRAIHARASLAAVMAILSVKVLKCRLIYDIRGFNAEEYVDGFGWSRRSARYQVLKRLERYLMLHATENIVLSEAASRVIATEQYVHGTRHLTPTVIPTCVDLDRFTFRASDARTGQPRHGHPDGVSVVYLGSLGTWYLLDEMIRFVAALHRLAPSVRLHCLTHSDPAPVRSAWRNAGLPSEALTVQSINHEEVPSYVGRGDVGLCFVKPSLSKQASYPTKIGEYLACGLPVVINAGLSDCDRFIYRHRIGVVVDSLTPSGYDAAGHQLLRLLDEGKTLQQRCRRAAEEHLALAIGVRRYQAVYRRCFEMVQAE